MKKAPGIMIVSVLLVLLAFLLLRHLPNAPSHEVRLALSVSYLALALLSLTTAVSLWRGAPKALVLYGIWAGAYLALGGAVEFICAGSPLVEVIMWWTLMGALLLAVGAHLRHVRRQAV